MRALANPATERFRAVQREVIDRFHRGVRGGQGGGGKRRNGQRRGEQGGGPHPADGSAGAGLGLSIVQAIASAHGGQATLESAPGRGTIVRVWLPSAS